MITKEKIIQTINELPDEFSIDELFDRIILLENIERGENDIKEEKTLTHNEAKERFGKWLRYNGH